MSQERIVSVHDPEMRHGRKSSHHRFDGHKASVAVEAGSQLITTVAVLPGNAPDNQGALALVSESEHHTGSRVCETVADAAYGDGETRRQFAEADRTLIAKGPKPPRGAYFTKQDFHIDLEAAVRPKQSRPVSTARGATAKSTGSGSRGRPLSSPARSVTAVACDHSV